MGLLPQKMQQRISEFWAVVQDKPLPESSYPAQNLPQRPLPVRVPDDDDDYQDAQVVDEEEDEEEEDQREYDLYRQRVYASQATHSATGAHGILRRWWIKVAQALLAVVCWIYLSLGNAQLFAGFQPWNTNGWTMLAYLGGFSFEFAGMALIFVAGIRWEQKKYPGFAWALGGAIFMALVSFVTQVLFVSVDLVSVHLPAIVINIIPFGFKGFVFLRALVPTVLEFTLVFLVAEKTVTVEETIESQRKERQAIHQLMIEDERAEQEHMATKAMSALMRAGTDAMQQSANLLVDNQQLLMQEMRPKMIVQHIHHDAEPAQQVQAPARQPDTFAPVDYTDVGKKPVGIQKPVYCTQGHASIGGSLFCGQCGESLQKSVQTPEQIADRLLPKQVRPVVSPKTVPLSTDDEKIRYAQASLARYKDIGEAAKALSAKYGGESQARFWLLKAQIVQKPTPSNGHKNPGDDDLALDDPLPFQ